MPEQTTINAFDKSPPRDSSFERCSTPIHPNQVIDGIKFIEEQDPTYKSSAVFDLCTQEEDEEEKVDL